MKKLVTLLLVLFCMAAMSQKDELPPWKRRAEPVIIILNKQNSKYLPITKRSNLTILTASGKSISGQVRMIKSDTLFVNDTSIKATQIDKIYLQRFPGRFDVSYRKPNYQSGSQNIQLICPPDSAYKSVFTYHAYVQNLVMKSRKSRLAPLNPLSYKNFIKWNIAKLAHLELGFSYERMIAKNLTWETELSAMYGIPSATLPNNFFYPVFNYNGISITTYPKYYFMPRTYVSFVVMYRYLVGDHMRSSWPIDASSTDIKTQYRNEYGVSLRIGFMRRYHKTVIDYYFGGGVKFITTHDLRYGYYPEDSNHFIWYFENHSPSISNKNLYWPVINLGIKIGRAF